MLASRQPPPRRILLVAGTAAGMSAIFRTPLGAALLAVEVLHKNDPDVRRRLAGRVPCPRRILPVVGPEGVILGLLGQADIARAYHEDIARRGEDASRERAG